MDLSLWDPPICEDESYDFDGNFAENWWQSDFYNGYGFYDVMEEDALNEKACMQVLKRMLSRAKTDIVEVEEEITALQRQLAWADEVWSKKHSTLTERINSLDVLIQKLNEEQQTENALDFQFQTLGEHAEKLNVMLKTLLESHTANIDVQNLSPKTEKLAPIHSEEETTLSDFIAMACNTIIMEDIVGPSCTGDQTRDFTAKDQNGNGTSSDLIRNCSTPATDVPIQWDMDRVNTSVHMGKETEYEGSTSTEKRLNGTSLDLMTNCYRNATDVPIQWDTERKPSTTVGEKRTYKIEVDKADMSSEDCTADAAKQITKYSLLKRRPKVQEDASRASLINTGKQVDRTGKMSTEYPQKMKQKEAWLSDSEFSQEHAMGEALREVLNNRREKAPRVEQVQNAGVVGKEPHKSTLFLKSGCPKLTEQPVPMASFAAPAPSRAMEMEPNISSTKNHKSSGVPPDGKNRGYKKNNKETDMKFEGDKSCNAAAADVRVFQPLEKRKKCMSSPVRKKNVDLKNHQVSGKMDEEVTRRLIEEQGVQIVPNSTTTMAADDSLSLVQLRAMAKERKLKGYSKLKKSDLIKLLG